jgi:hypothetical protein
MINRTVEQLFQDGFLPRIPHEERVYQDGKLVRIVGEEVQYEITYSGQGYLESIVGHYFRYGLTQLEYRRPQTNETHKALCHKLHRAFLALIPTAIQKLEIQEPVFAIVLSYSVANLGTGFLPPHLGLIYDRDRQAVVASEKGIMRLWNPYNFPHSNVADMFAMLDTPLRETCRLMNQEMILSPKGCKLGQRLLRRITHDLSFVDWSATLPTAPDFVVYTRCDEGLSDEVFLRDLSFSVSPEQIADFGRRGYFTR